jgi:hypothetical protein
VEPYVHIFKLRVVGITRKEKDDTAKSVPRIRVKLLCPSSFFSRVGVLHADHSKLFAKIENFLRFQLARKSITLLFFHNVFNPPYPEGLAKSGQRYKQKTEPPKKFWTFCTKTVFECTTLHSLKRVSKLTPKSSKESKDSGS